jgi:hypothetical protein
MEYVLGGKRSERQRSRRYCIIHGTPSSSAVSSVEEHAIENWTGLFKNPGLYILFWAN